MIRTLYILLGIVFVLASMFVGPKAYATHESGHNASGSDIIDNVISDLTGTSTDQNSVAGGFSRDGIFGCTGASYGSVGMQGPGGSHVPVFDDAVHDQVRLLTYKECLLDGIANASRETLVSDIVKRVVNWANSGFDGNPSYVTNLPLHMLERIADPEAARVILGSETEELSATFRRDVRVALAKSYATETRRPEHALRCSLSEEKLQALSQGDLQGAGGLEALFTFATDSSCNPLFAFNNAKNRLDRAVASERERERTLLDWGRGFRSAKVNTPVDIGNGNTAQLERIVTPGFLIAEHLSQALGTGLRQSENADEIDEIVSALMSHIGVEFLSDAQGLSGLSRSFGGQSSYLDRLVADSASRTRGNMTGAAEDIVNNTIRIEREYLQERRRAVDILDQSTRQLRSWERTCWTGILDQARTELSDRVAQRVCDKKSSTSGENNTSNQCSASATISEETQRGAFGIRVPQPAHITAFGRTAQNGSSIEVLAENGDEQTGPFKPSVDVIGTWATQDISLATMPDGDITVTTRETLVGNSGTLPSVTATVKKETTILGVELFPPTELPAVTITATAGTVSESVTIATSTRHSRQVITENIRPLLIVLYENIARAEKALEALLQIKAALESTVSASGQRFILERLDKLIAARVIHTEAQLRQARGQTGEIEAAMQQLLEETREDWEAGWCNQDNWEQHAQ